MLNTPRIPTNGILPTARDPTGSSLSDSEWAKWFCRARTPVELGRLGDYELLAEIGHGAQGTVYKARQPGTRRDVVIKRLAAGAFATPSMRARFERETMALAALRHPHIVTVHSTEVVDGQPILVMEWVDGQPIDRWASIFPGPNGPGPRRGACEVLTVFAQVCDAVAHAHQHGIIHRDLKPSNILIDAADHPRVLDFGLATSLTEGARLSRAAISRTHGFVGTPMYASPEQIAGDPQSVDTRTDLFSLGVILYELLTGVWPFIMKTTRAEGSSLADVFDAIRSVEPRRPSTHRRELGAELDAIVLKAIARDPALRYQSADAMAADVRRFLAGEPVWAHAPTTLYQLRTLVRRHRLGFAVSVLIFAIVFVSAIVSTSLAVRLAGRENDLIDSQKRERDHRIAAEVAGARAADEASKVRATNDFLQTLLTTDDPVSKLRPDVHLRELLAEAGKSLDAGILATQPLVEAAVRATIGHTYMSLRMVELAEPHLRRAFEIRTAPTAADNLDLADSIASLAVCLCEQRKFDEGIPLHRRALDMRRALNAVEDAAQVQRLSSYSVALRDRGDLAEAESIARQALDLSVRVTGERHSTTADCRFRLGYILSRQRKYDEAEREQREALALQQALRGPGHPSCGDSLLRLGQTLVSQRKAADGEALIREGISVLSEALGSAHPNTSRAKANLARLLTQQRRFDEAESLYPDLVDAARKYFGDKNAKVGERLATWARIRVRRGDFAGAEALMREALSIYDGNLGDDHPTARALRLELADMLAKRGGNAEGEERSSGSAVVP